MIFLIKLGASSPRATEIPISFLIVHLFFWRPLKGDQRLFLTQERTLEP